MIRIPIFGTEVTVEDTLVNRAHAPEEYAQLYHCNFGWPLVSEEARVELPEQRKTTPRTPFAHHVAGLSYSASSARAF